MRRAFGVWAVASVVLTGLPVAPASAVVVAPHDWLGEINLQRAAAGLPPVTEDPGLSAGDALHAHWMATNGILSHGEIPGSPEYTVEGDQAGQQSNVAVGCRTAVDCVDLWLRGPFHAVGILDPALARTGFGSEGPWAALNVLGGLADDPQPGVRFPVVWPAWGSTIHLTTFGRGERPDPLASCPGYGAGGQPVGLPLLVMFESSAPLTGFSLVRQGVGPLDACAFDGASYSNPDPFDEQTGRGSLGGRNAAVVVPRLPLEPGGLYTLIVEAGTQRAISTFWAGTETVPGWDPFGNLDAVADIGPGSLGVAGWMIDPSHRPDAHDVHIYVDGVASAATTDVASPDVDGAWPGATGNHRFAVALPVPGGVHQVCAYGINVGPGSNSLLGCLQVTTGGSPVGSLDVASPAGAGGLRVAGWAGDLDTAELVDVHVYVDGVGFPTRTGLDRPDVANAFPRFGAVTGYDVVVPAGPGTHTVCAYAIDVGFGENNLLGCRTAVT